MNECNKAQVTSDKLNDILLFILNQENPDGEIVDQWRGGMTKNMSTVNVLMAHFEDNDIDPKLLSENFLENEHGRDVEKELFAVEDDESDIPTWVAGCFPRKVRNIQNSTKHCATTKNKCYI